MLNMFTILIIKNVDHGNSSTLRERDQNLKIRRQYQLCISNDLKPGKLSLKLFKLKLRKEKAHRNYFFKTEQIFF